MLIKTKKNDSVNSFGIKFGICELAKKKSSKRDENEVSNETKKYCML
jgi:hypothetical protein